VPQSAILRFSTRFLAVTRVGDAITASGRVAEKLELDGRRLVRIALAAHDQRGEQKTAGEALVSLT